MALRPEPNNTTWPFPFTAHDWEQTPPAVQAYVRALHEEMQRLRDEMGHLHERVETLEARVRQNSTTSSQPPSSDAPYKKPRRRGGAQGARKGGGKPGHLGHRQMLMAPTTVQDVLPATCACGSDAFTLL